MSSVAMQRQKPMIPDGYELLQVWLCQNGFEIEWDEDWHSVLGRYAAWEFGAQGELGL